MNKRCSARGLWLPFKTPIGAWLLLLTALAGSVACAESGADSNNILVNADFEQAGAAAPEGWSLGEGAAAKGTVTLVPDQAGGGHSVQMAPNSNNLEAEKIAKPFSIGQGFAAKPYRGKTLYLRARMAATGGATAVINVYAHRSDGSVLNARLTQSEQAPGLRVMNGSLAIPDDGKTKFVVLLCAAEGNSGSATFDDIYLGLAKPPSAASATSAAAPTKASIVVDANTTLRQIPPTLFGTNLEWVWDAGGLWNEQTAAPDAGVVKLAQDLRPTLLRFPGGIFNDFYHWRDGVGPRNKRATTPHMPDGPSSRHNFGTDEALAFAQSVGGSLLITVNIVTGTPEEAADWVRYVNQPQQSAAAAPRVLYWEIGNENYIKGDVPYQKEASLDPKEYAERYIKFADAMRAADPRIRLCAISDDTFSRSVDHAYRNWTRTVLRKAANKIDCIAVHNGYSPTLPQDQGWDVRSVYQAMLASPLLIGESLRRVADEIRHSAPERAEHIKIAVTEWGPNFQMSPDGRFIDHGKTLGSALYVAGAMNAYLSSPQTDVALFFKLVDKLWMGWIGPRGQTFTPKASYKAFKLYREHVGSKLLKTAVTSPTYDSPQVGYVDALTDVPLLDAIASSDDTGKELHLLVTNRDLDNAIAADVQVSGFDIAPAATVQTLSGQSIDSNTGTELFKAPGVKWAEQAADGERPRFKRGGPAEVPVTDSALTVTGDRFSYSFPPRSITALTLVRRR